MRVRGSRTWTGRGIVTCALSGRVLCLVEADWPLIGGTFTTRGGQCGQRSSIPSSRQTDPHRRYRCRDTPEARTRATSGLKSAAPERGWYDACRPPARIAAAGVTHFSRQWIRWSGRAAPMHGYARRQQRRGLACGRARWAIGQIGESAHTGQRVSAEGRLCDKPEKRLHPVQGLTCKPKTVQACL